MDDGECYAFPGAGGSGSYYFEPASSCWRRSVQGPPGPNKQIDGGSGGVRNDLIQLRRGTPAEWAALNPVLAAGEFGWDGVSLRAGDGAEAWNDLPDVNDRPGGTLARAAKTTNQSNITSIVDVTGLSITFTVREVAGQVVPVEVLGRIAAPVSGSATACDVTVSITDAANTLLAQAVTSTRAVISTLGSSVVAIERITVAGTYTRKLRCQSVGTLTLAGSAVLVDSLEAREVPVPLG